MANRLTPEIRFEGFNREWEEKQFSNFVERLNKTSTSNQIPKIEFEDIVAGEGILNKNITNKFDDRKGILFDLDNILYGKLRPYLKNWLFADFKGIALGDFWVFKANKSDPRFVYTLIQSDNYQKVANDTAGTKMPRSDWKKVSTTNFSIPQSIKEQTQIGSFFKQLDDSIALQQQELDTLKQTKQGFLQKMFPKEGETVPEIRFLGFSGEWEEKKLSELGKVTTGKAFSSKDFDKNGAYLVITNKDISNSTRSQNIITDRINSSDSELINKYRLSGDNLLVTMDGVNLGKTAMYSNEKALLAQRVGRIQAQNLDFIFQVTNSSNFLSTMRKLSVGNAIKHISLKQISDYTVYSPSNEEQAQIGAFFKQLDDTIALHEQELDALKETKKAFLQKMFV